LKGQNSRNKRVRVHDNGLYRLVVLESWLDAGNYQLEATRLSCKGQRKPACGLPTLFSEEAAQQQEADSKRNGQAGCSGKKPF